MKTFFPILIFLRFPAILLSSADVLLGTNKGIIIVGAAAAAAAGKEAD